MAKKKTNSTDYSVEEMKARVGDLDKEIFALRNELAVNRKLDKPHLIKAKRREKARLLTIMTQKNNRSKEVA
ncbi:MAG TPA: 50S ribosomal protein L29 [Chlamydiales bacterium]|jgi:large subunit ribosomal protein L29|nr:50S ribosomal protein L29 [Chlamydiales bacterium]